MRLLVVDESESVRAVLRAHATAWGIEALEASTAAQALETLSEASRGGAAFDTAILAAELGEMGGKEVAARIKADQRLRSTRLVFLQVLGQAEQPRQLARYGFDAWISKPVSSSKLLTALVHVSADADQLLQSAEGPSITGTREGGARFRSRVLVVEDNVVNQKVASLMLRRLGCTVLMASDGEEALSILSRGDIDLVLMDCQMPVMNGFQATREIRLLRDEVLSSVPIVAMTANAMPGDRERCLEAGMNDYLSKPVQSKDLARMVERWTREAEAAAPRPLTTETDMRDDGDDRVLDPEMIDALRALGGEDDPGLFKELVELFLQDTPQRIGEIVAALESDDAQRLERAAHALKSSSANLGAMALSELCRELEAAGKHADLARAQTLVERSREEYRRVEQALGKEIA
jgi:CheY-like chemotaxis protein/HPt (histidine-containing phosphotransfer) domain-containing protein